MQEPLLTEPPWDLSGPFEPESDSSSKPFPLSARVAYKGANSANLEGEPVD